MFEESNVARITLLRHGQSEGNVLRGRARRDLSLRDCGLTRRGVEEARNVGRAQTHAPDLIVVSPLRRALLTTLNLNFQNCPIIVHPGLCEHGGEIPENFPLPLHQLLQSPDLSRFSRLQDIDFSLLPANWGREHSQGSRMGVAQALRWLRARTEKNIWVVCHFNVIHTMISTRRFVGNCEPISCQFSGNDLIEITDKRMQDAEEELHEPKKFEPRKRIVHSGRVSIVLEAERGIGAFLVGNADFAADKKALDDAQVGAVLVVGGSMRTEESIDRAVIRVAVSDRQDTVLPHDFLETTTAWIHEQRTKYNRTTLVHCRAGHHQSPLVAAAYLLRYHSNFSSVDHALAAIREVRPAATFPSYIQAQLDDWHSSFSRKRMASSSSSSIGDVEKK